MADPATTKDSSLATESKTMAKHSLIYGLGNVLNRVVGFVMIPIYTRYLVPAEYGILELLSLTTEVVGMLMSMRISRAMYRFYFEYEDEQDRNEVISTAIISFAGLGLLGLLLGALGSSLLAELILDSSSYGYYFIISFTSLWFNTIVMMAYDYLRVQKRSVLFVTISTIRLIIGLSLNIYFVVFQHMGVPGILYGNLAGSGAACLFLVFPVLRQVGTRVSRQKLRDMLGFSLPLIPGALANFVVLASDRYFVKMFGSLADTGIYSLSYKFGVLPHTFVTVPFFQIWSVRRFELLKGENAEELMGRIITYFMAVSIFVGLGISALAKDTIRIMADPQFWDAYKYVPILILSYVIYGLFNNFATNILITKKTKLLSYIDIINGVMNIALNIVLIKYYGIYGAAFATLISYAIRIAMLYFVASRLGKIYFEFTRVTKVLLCASSLYGICEFITIDSAIWSLLTKTCVVLLLPAFLVLVRFYSDSEISRINGAFKAKNLRMLWQ